MIEYTKQGRWTPGSESLERWAKEVTTGDFVQDHPNVPIEELELFTKEYRMTSQGFFNGMTEDAYQILYGTIHPRYSDDELVERLAFLRDRARFFAEINQNPNRKESNLTGKELVEREQECFRLNRKRLSGTITDNEMLRLKCL